MLERQIQDQSLSCEDLSLVAGVQHEHQDFRPKTPPSTRADEFGDVDVDDAMGSVDMNMVFCADWLNDSLAWPGMITPLSPLVHGSEQPRELTPNPTTTTLASLELSDLAWADLWVYMTCIERE